MAKLDVARAKSVVFLTLQSVGEHIFLCGQSFLGSRGAGRKDTGFMCFSFRTSARSTSWFLRDAHHTARHFLIGTIDSGV